MEQLQRQRRIYFMKKSWYCRGGGTASASASPITGRHRPSVDDIVEETREYYV